MNSKKPYLPAIEANLRPLKAILTNAMREAECGLAAAEVGNQNGAAGAIILCDEMLKQASILVQAVLVLHRQR